MTECDHQLDFSRHGNAPKEATAYVVMGVSGVGKTQVGKDLAASLGAVYEEADDYHPEENIQAMQQGTPLTDEMRWPWLIRLSQAVEVRRQAGDVVVACSALRRCYRDLIRAHVRHVRFVFLTADREVIAGRLAKRTGHFMPPHMLESQLQTLEAPTADERPLRIDVSGSREDVLAQVLKHLGAN